MTDLYIPRRRDDDEISLISMRELAPSPIEDEEFYVTVDDAATPPLSKSPTFGHSRGSSIAYWLASTQRYSSYAFLGFLGVHGATAVLSPLAFGVDAGNSSILLARTYFYQATPYTELLLIPGTLGLHIGAGLALRVHKYFQQKSRYGGRAPKNMEVWRWRNFSTVSRTGILVAPFVALHATLMRLVPLAVDEDSSQVTLEYLAYGFWHSKLARWVGGFFYTGMVGLLSYHVVYGAAQYWKVPQRRRRLVGATAIATAVVWLGGLTRVVVESGKVSGYLGRHYEHLYKVFFRRL